MNARHPEVAYAAGAKSWVHFTANIRRRLPKSVMMGVHFGTRRLNTQALFERLFASLPEGIVVVDGGGRIIEANPQMELLFGYENCELIGKPVEVLVPERFRSAHEELMAACHSQPSTRSMGAGLELYGTRKDGSEFPADIMLTPVEIGEERLVLGIVRDVSERKRLEQWMLQLALSDPLTGLGNYRRLQEAFETETKWCQRTGRSCALLLLDLDRLKQINDAHGHLVGSRALCRVADVLRTECRSIDTPARHGGDEFAVLLPDTDAAGAQNLAWRLATRLANDGGVPSVSFSYGVALYSSDGETLDQLLQAADDVLYRMKRSKH